MLLGLCICSRPAALKLDMLFFGRSAGRQSSKWSDIMWLALNILVLLSGWTVIFIGTTRFVSREAWSGDSRRSCERFFAGENRRWFMGK